MPDKSCGFIHLTDLHFGKKDLTWFWPNLREEFYEDLKWSHDYSGPWDLILFTGDLAFSGKEEEFRELDTELLELSKFIKNLQGYEPAFLPIPGNHDMQRRPENDPLLKALKDWHSDKSVRDDFWNGSFYDPIKKEAFAEY